MRHYSPDKQSVMGFFCHMAKTFAPVMMTALLLYAYGQGSYASQRIAQACEKRVDFMAVTAQQCPDFRRIRDFRKRRLN